ncbi:helix-turn-helix domain-containing protein [Lactococcus lactis]|jgi:Predicted transcriptional regulators|uniref:helix-turn-helix domain-containing protein n=1 Tax=Lactococcus lactis TaxID=1358 RepID=UPI00071C6F6E|nr:helix-turn-helix transcriptional regulator [Lactococcus lactis]
MEENIFFDRVKRLSRVQKKSINQIERDLGYSRNSLNSYRNGRSPSAQRLLEVADYFGVSPYYLMGQKEDSGKNFVELFFKFLTVEQREELYFLYSNYQNNK